MTPQQFTEFMLQSKDIVAMFLLSAVIWHQQTKHIPMILIREEKKQEADRALFKDLMTQVVTQNKAVEQAVDKLGDKVTMAVEHVREVVKDLLIEVVHSNLDRFPQKEKLTMKGDHK
jgi:hypothetical protein